MCVCHTQMLGKIEKNDETMIHRNNHFQSFTQSLQVLFRSVPFSAVNGDCSNDQTAFSLLSSLYGGVLIHYALLVLYISLQFGSIATWLMAAVLLRCVYGLAPLLLHGIGLILFKNDGRRQH